MKVTALVLQTWFDIAIRYTGSASNAYFLAFNNGFSVTDPISLGQEIKIDESITIATREVNFFNSKGVMPSTDFKGNTLPNKPTGIDYMIIGTDFIVR